MFNSVLKSLWITHLKIVLNIHSQGMLMGFNLSLSHLSSPPPPPPPLGFFLPICVVLPDWSCFMGSHYN